MDQDLPRFTARDTAIVPFAPAIESLTAATHHDFATADTTRYWTELSCTTPVSVRSNSTDWDDGIVEINDAHGCHTRIRLPISSGNEKSQSDSKILGVYRNLGMLGCSQGTFLAAFMHVDGNIPDFTDSSNASAVICDSSYWSESVVATVTSRDQIFGPLVPTGPKRPVSDSEFNTSRFEYLLSTGYVPELQTFTRDELIGFDIASVTRPVLRNRLSKSDIYYDSEEYLDTAVAYALASSGLNASAFLDVSTISRVFSKVHKLLFATAASSSMSQILDVPAQGSISEQKTVITMIQGFTIATQCLLIIVIFALVCLYVSYSRRCLRLLQDPDSMARVVELARNQNIQDVFKHSGSLDEDPFQRSIELCNFALDYDSDGAPLLTTTRQGSNHAETFDSKDVRNAPRYAIEADWISIAPVALLMFAVIIVLLVLNQLAQHNRGLRFPSTNTFYRQLALDVAPTLFATLLGVYLKTICRTMCFLSPMEDLRAGYANASTTLSARYTAILPQLVSWRALCARHYLLCVLGMVALTSHLLIVSLAGLFEQRYVSMQSHLPARRLFEPRTTPTASYAQVDPFYIAVANVSSNTSMPNWATPQYSFIPIELPESQDPHAVYVANMTGYGADLDCQQLSSTNKSVTYDLSFIAGTNTTAASVQMRLGTTFSRSDGRITTCEFFESDTDLGNYNPTIGVLGQQSALEIAGGMLVEPPTSSLSDHAFCNTRMISAWIRAQPRKSLTEAKRNTSDATGMYIDHQETVVLCEPRIKAAQFEVRFYHNGSIIQAKSLNLPTYELPPEVQFMNSIDNIRTVWGSGPNLRYPQWHNDTFARDWPNYLLKMSSPDAVKIYLDASQPPPDAKRAMADLSDNFSRLFVAHLAIRQDSLVPISNTTTTDSPSISTLIPVTIITNEERLFLSKPMLIISVTLLTIDVLAMLAFRLNLSKAFLPRMPFTLAAQIAYFSSSRVVDDIVEAAIAERRKDRNENDDDQDDITDHENPLANHRYGYGRYIGKDGQPHIGIQREPFVVKLDSSTDSIMARVLTRVGLRRRKC